MKLERLQFLAQHLSARDFILVYIEQREEFDVNRKVQSRSITQEELEKYIPNPKAVKLALFRLKGECLIERTGKKEWVKLEPKQV